MSEQGNSVPSNNPVAKYMEKFNRPATHRNRKRYDRKRDKRRKTNKLYKLKAKLDDFLE